MDMEALLTSQQKADVVKAAIMKYSEGTFGEGEFAVRYDRRYSHIFEAFWEPRSDGLERLIVVFSISPVKEEMDTFFQSAAREAARAIDDMLHCRIDAASQPRPSQEITCPCCESKVRIVTS